MDKEIFVLINRIDDLKNLWNDLAKYRTEIQCKGEADELITLAASLYNPNSQTLYCSFKNSNKFTGFAIVKIFSFFGNCILEVN